MVMQAGHAPPYQFKCSTPLELTMADAICTCAPIRSKKLLLRWSAQHVLPTGTVDLAICWFAITAGRKEAAGAIGRAVQDKVAGDT